MEYILKKGTAEAVVNELGGEMTAYRADGLLYTWTGDAAYWPGKAPVLFPNVCTLKDNTVTFGGKAYQIEKHGFARRSMFATVERDDEHIVFELQQNENTLKMYPFDFSLKIAYTLTDGGFQCEYTVTNNGGDDMPFCIGGHPAFRVPLKDGESFSDYALVFEKDEAPRAHYTDNGLMDDNLVKQLDFKDGKTLPLRYKDFDDDALVFTNLNSQKLWLLGNGHGLEFSFAGFPVLGVWTPPQKNAPFICLEPWVGLPAYKDEDGSFEHKPHAVVLKAGEEFRARYGMRRV